MPDLETNVEHIMFNKARLLWGIIVATLVLGGVFYKLQLDLALASQKLDTLIVSFDKLNTKIVDEQEKQNNKITELEKTILVLTNKK